MQRAVRGSHIGPALSIPEAVVLPPRAPGLHQHTATPHLGPTAQDSYAAFGLGTDDKHIATVDAGGVALAAIQGLSQLLDDRTPEFPDSRNKSPRWKNKPRLKNQ